ncbi:MAG: sigma 54-interacting transcriptional regulator [Planctomycetota bacterium]
MRKIFRWDNPNHGQYIFVDELHGTETWFQQFLLQVIDGMEISQAHGGPTWVKSEVRMIFASNKPLSKLAIEHDLLARLREWIIEVPPLVERNEDIVLFVEKWCKGYKQESQFLLALLRHNWPGNVRELENVLKKATALAGKPPVKLRVEHLELVDMSVIDAVREMPETDAEREVMQFLVQTFESQGLRRGQGLQKRLAEFLRISQSEVSKRLTSLDINFTTHD